MSNGPWTDEENDLIVADYFAMLAEDMACVFRGNAPTDSDLMRPPVPISSAH